MDWLDDTSVASFLDSSSDTTIFYIGSNKMGVLHARTGSWLGLIVRRNGSFDAFSPSMPNGVRVPTFSGALSLVALSETAMYAEVTRSVPVEEEAADGD